MNRKMPIRFILSSLMGIFLIGLTGWVGKPALAYSQHGQSDMERAIASYQALQTYFYKSDGSSLYLEAYPQSPSANSYSYEWPFSQAHMATIDLLNMPGQAGSSFSAAVDDRSIGQEHYWNTTGATGLPGYDSYVRPPYGNGGDKFYDDNEWVGLAKIELYKTTGDQSALLRAQQIFSLVVSGWDTNTTHADPGGVFWTQASWSHDRNTVSNMPGAELGLRLFQITGNQYYFDWAKKMYDWTNQYLLAPNGLYWDHIDLSGNVQKTQWSYNQGVPVGVDVLLYQITGDPLYLTRAEKLAAAALSFYNAGNALYGQPPFFNSIFFKNLLLLQSVDHNQNNVQAMKAYADTIWNNYRDPATGLFKFNGASNPTQMIEQAAMTQIYAVLAWSPSKYKDLY